MYVSTFPECNTQEIREHIVLTTMAQYDFGDSRIVACVTVKQDNIFMSKVIGMIKQ